MGVARVATVGGLALLAGVVVGCGGGGLFPGDPAGAYMHHPMSHIITNQAEMLTAYPPDTSPLHQEVADFLANVHTWYNQKTADILVDFKNSQDVFGGNLLQNTIVPFVTDVSCGAGGWSPLPALIFGGSKLGMLGGQIMDFSARGRPHSDMWMTIAQAYLRTDNPVAALAAEAFMKTGVAPIPNLWSAAV